MFGMKTKREIKWGGCRSEVGEDGQRKSGPRAEVMGDGGQGGGRKAAVRRGGGQREPLIGSGG